MESDPQTTINFGSRPTGKICWSEERVENSFSNTELENKYTELFQKMWYNRQGDWKQATEYWKGICSNKWLFNSQVDTKEFLGLCGNSNSQQQWITVENKNLDNPTIKICSGHCFTSSTQSSWQYLQSNKPIGSWKEIKFYEQNN